MLDYLTFVILVKQAGIERTWTTILRIIINLHTID